MVSKRIIDGSYLHPPSLSQSNNARANGYTEHIGTCTIQRVNYPRILFITQTVALLFTQNCVTWEKCPDVLDDVLVNFLVDACYKCIVCLQAGIEGMVGILL